MAYSTLIGIVLATACAWSNAAAETVDFGGLHLSAPAGWTVVQEDGYLDVKPPGANADNCSLILVPATEPDKPFAAWAAETWGQLAGLSPVDAARALKPRKDGGADILVASGPVVESGETGHATMWAFRLGPQAAEALFIAADVGTCRPFLAESERMLSPLFSGETKAGQQAALDPEILGRVATFMSWGYHVQLNAAAAERLRRQLAADSAGGDAEGIESLRGLATIQRNIEQLPPADRQASIALIEMQFMAVVRAEPDPDTAWLLALHDASHPRIAAGDPPLTREEADALLALSAFRIEKATGQPVSLNEGQREEWMSSLVSRWPNVSAEERVTTLNSLTELAILRAAWPQIDSAKREELLTAWRTEYGVENAVAGKTGCPQGDEYWAIQGKETLTHHDPRLDNCVTKSAAASPAYRKAAFQMMQEAGVRQHVSNMNIIENMNVDGPQNYWYVGR